MADQYDKLADTLGLSPEAREKWRAMANLPPASKPAPAPAPVTNEFGLPVGNAAMRNGMPVLALQGPDVQQAIAASAPPPKEPVYHVKDADKLVAASNARDAAAEKVYQAQKDQKNIEGATFVDSPAPGGGLPASPVASAPILVSPGGRTPASWTTQVQSGIPLSDETRAATSKAEASQADAAAEAFNAGASEANRELGYLQAHERYQAQRQQMLEQRAEQQRKAYETQLAKLESITNQVRSDQVDTTQFFTKNGGNAFMASLGVLVGGIGQAFAARGGMQIQNPGMTALNNAIAQNIDAQKANIALNRGKLEDQRSLLGQMAKTFGDERVAEDAAWIAYLEKAKTSLAAGAAESKSEWAQARYKSAISDIDREIAGRREKWDQLTADRIVTAQHDVNAPPQYIGGASALSKADRSEAADVGKLLVEKGIPQARAQLEEIDRAIDTFGDGDIPGIGPIASKVPDVLAGAVFGERASVARQQIASLKNGIRKSIAGSSLTDSEKAELNKSLEGAGDAASLRRVVQSFRSSLSAQERAIRSVGSDTANAEQYRRQQANAKYAVPLDKGAAPYVRPPE